MGDESLLRAGACEATKVRKLPDRRPEHIWGGPGSGEVCAVCGKTIGAEEVEIELQFTSNGDSNATNYHVHARCFAVWERERRHGDANGHSLPPGSNGVIIPGRERHTTNRGKRGRG